MRDSAISDYIGLRPANRRQRGDNGAPGQADGGGRRRRIPAILTASPATYRRPARDW